MIIMSSQHVMKGEEVQKWIQLDASLRSLLKKKHIVSTCTKVQNITYEYTPMRNRFFNSCGRTKVLVSALLKLLIIVLVIHK